MNSRSIDTAKVTIKNGELDINAYLATPAAAGIYPAIVVIQEIFGVNAHIRDVTERFAQNGYIAIAPAIYQRLAPDFEAGYTLEDMTVGRVYKNQTKAEELLSDIQATIDYLYTLPQVKRNGVGCIGFCFGGHVAYLVATLADIKATASFYGAGITSWCPGDGVPTIDYTRDIKGTLLAFFGLADASIPEAEIDRLEAKLEKYDIPHQIFRYPEAEHGFFCDRRSSYQQLAAVDAWNRVLDLFRQILS
jgi:carboxymethylenebutenolidase